MVTTTTVVEPPEGLVVSLVEAKRHLRIDHTDDDTYITALIGAATSILDGPNGYLGRCLLTQTLETRLTSFHCGNVPLLYGPVQDIVSVQYNDGDGVLQTMDEDIYRIISGAPVKLAPVYGEYWPTVQAGNDAIVIQYNAGYGDTGADVPAPIRQAILLTVGHLFENRESVIVGLNPAVMPLAADYLTSPYRVMLV